MTLVLKIVSSPFKIMISFFMLLALLDGFDEKDRKEIIKGIKQIWE